MNQIRGLNPWPTANFYLEDLEYKALEAEFVPKNQKETGKIVDVTKTAIGISCADGILYITKLKPFGKKVMFTKDFLNGLKKEKILNQKVK